MFNDSTHFDFVILVPTIYADLSSCFLTTCSKPFLVSKISANTLIVSSNFFVILILKIFSKDLSIVFSTFIGRIIFLFSSPFFICDEIVNLSLLYERLDIRRQFSTFLLILFLMTFFDLLLCCPVFESIFHYSYVLLDFCVIFLSDSMLPRFSALVRFWIYPICNLHFGLSHSLTTKHPGFLQLLVSPFFVDFIVWQFFHIF